MGIAWDDDDVRPFLGGDTAPMVYPVGGNSVFTETAAWVAYGGCRGINKFDAILINGGEQLAVFNDGTSGYSAGTLFEHTNGTRVISFPYDLLYVRTPPTVDKAGAPASTPVRAQVLGEVVSFFGHPPNIGFETPAELPGKIFAVNAYPNPFNPATKIAFSVPKAGHLSLKIFNVRGELVRTLINEVRPAGDGEIMWTGTNDQNKRVSSGVYFLETRTKENVLVNKMTMVQ